MEVTANEIPSRRGWSCQRATLALFNVFANYLEKEGEMHRICFIWFSRKEARLSPAPGRPLIPKHCYPSVGREMDCSEAAQAIVWENARWWRWWQQYKRICSNYLPGEGAAQEQSSSWRKQNAVKQINKSLSVAGGVFNKPAGIFAPNYFKYLWYFHGEFLISSFHCEGVHSPCRHMSEEKEVRQHSLLWSWGLTSQAGGRVARGVFEWAAQWRSRGREREWWGLSRDLTKYAKARRKRTAFFLPFRWRQAWLCCVLHSSLPKTEQHCLNKRGKNLKTGKIE